MNPSLPTEAGQNNPNIDRTAQVDAINQVFALFRLNFHAQFFKAFSTENELIQIKKLWLSELSRFDSATLLKGAKRIIESTDFLPTLHTMIRHCEQVCEGPSLPDPHSAYIEACRAPSPKIEYHWSHPAVYFAGKTCDWYFLQTNAEATAYPVFKKKYIEICDRVRSGETLTLPKPSRKKRMTSQPLDKEENLKRLSALKNALDL